MKVVHRNNADLVDSYVKHNHTVARNQKWLDRDGTITEAFRDRIQNRIYILGVESTQTMIGNAFAINTLFAVQFRVEYPTQVDQLGCHISVGTSGNFRIGIYSDLDGSAPDKLLIDSGDIVVASAGTKMANVSLTLAPGVYWAVYLTDTANTQFSVGVNAPYNQGYDPAVSDVNSPITFLSVAFTYGALPSTFPAGFAYNNGTIPGIAWREI